MRSRLAQIAEVLVGVALAVSVFANLWFLAAVDDFKEGSREGFYLPGTYQAQEDAGTAIAFAESFQNAREGTWQWRPGHAEWLTGSYCSSEDPNRFLLTDSSGAEIGWVDLRYGTQTSDGFLYLSLGGNVFPMVKVSDPVFIEPTG